MLYFLDGRAGFCYAGPCFNIFYRGGGGPFGAVDLYASERASPSRCEARAKSQLELVAQPRENMKSDPLRRGKHRNESKHAAAFSVCLRSLVAAWITSFRW